MLGACPLLGPGTTRRKLSRPSVGSNGERDVLRFSGMSSGPGTARREKPESDKPFPLLSSLRPGAHEAPPHTARSAPLRTRPAEEASTQASAAVVYLSTRRRSKTNGLNHAHKEPSWGPPL